MSLKIKTNLIKRIKQYRKDYKEDLNEFGFKVAFIKYFCAVCFLHNSPLYINTLQKYVNGFYSKYIISYFDLYKTLDNNEENIKIDKIPVWVCWFQGEENMPELNKICYNRLKQVLPTDNKV